VCKLFGYSSKPQSEKNIIIHCTTLVITQFLEKDNKMVTLTYFTL